MDGWMGRWVVNYIYMYFHVHVHLCHSTTAVLVSDRPGSWAVAGDQVIMTLQGVEMNKLRYTCTHNTILERGHTVHVCMYVHDAHICRGV